MCFSQSAMLACSSSMVNVFDWSAKAGQLINGIECKPLIPLLPIQAKQYTGMPCHCLKVQVKLSGGLPCRTTALKSISSAKWARNITPISTGTSKSRPGLLRTALRCHRSNVSAGKEQSEQSSTCCMHDKTSYNYSHVTGLARSSGLRTLHCSW